MHLTPTETYDKLIDVATRKTELGICKMIILSLFAGAFIALAGAGATVAGYFFNGNNMAIGIGKTLSGTVFTAGLMMVVITGAELFTGNNLMIMALCERKIKLSLMLRNWVIVYIGNLVGSFAVAWMFFYGNAGSMENGLLGKVALATATAKVSLPFGKAFILGVMCNFLVCMAVWISTGATSTTGKLMGIFFPIWLFVTAGFEHSVANMFFIPLGMFLQGGDGTISLGGYFLGNLLPVTMGNIVGGGICLGLGAYMCYNKKNR